MSIDITRLSEVPADKLSDNSVLQKVTLMGNVIETMYIEHENRKQTIQMRPGGNEYVVCSTGEIKDVVHHETRKDNKIGLLKTFARCRALINTNVTDCSKVRWCTLTYAENMRDPRRLMKDFEKFNKRFQTFCKGHGWSCPEYIVMMEPQARGAWHAHLLYIWQDMKAPYIANNVFRDIWKQGFVKIKKLENVDNVGAYLTAYLGDMELSETGNPNAVATKQVEIHENGGTVKKSIVKGARLDLYPANFNMIRHSQGIKEPEIEYLTETQIQKKVSAATKTFESAVKLSDSEHDFESVIIKRQYNTMRKKKQD